MGSLSAVEERLPPGFRFHPRDEELICDFLGKWVSGCAPETAHLIQVDLNKCEPWNIPDSACVGGREWYFYSPRDRKYSSGIRTNRATESGYWKATGKDRAIIQKGVIVGRRKTLVFYQGRPPKGRKTQWVMHEFRLEQPHGLAQTFMPLQADWALSRVFYKSISSSSSAKQKQEKLDSCSQFETPLLDSEQQFLYNQEMPFGIEQVPCFSIFETTQTMNQPRINHHGMLSDYSYGNAMFLNEKYDVGAAVFNQFTGVEAPSIPGSSGGYLY